MRWTSASVFSIVGPSAVELADPSSAKRRTGQRLLSLSAGLWGIQLSGRSSGMRNALQDDQQMSHNEGRFTAGVAPLALVMSAPV